MKFQGIEGGEFSRGENAQRFEDDNNAGSVIVSTRAASGGGTSGGIVMGGYNHRAGVVSGNARDEGGLVEGRVGEFADDNGRVGGSDAGNGVE